MKTKIALVGAGSRSFGPNSVRDIMLSDILTEGGIDLFLVDTIPENMTDIEVFTHHLAKELNRDVQVTTTTDLAPALDGAHFVILAIEVNRFFYWTQDFIIPRRYGFNQVFGENGGPGGLFHALRNMGPVVEIARAMERHCPEAILLNFTNPEHKLCEAVSRLTSIRNIGLCHGVFGGQQQIAKILDRPLEELDTAACGMNHITFFQKIADKATGEDLYPLLREKEKQGDWLCEWHEIAMGRILFRRFGLWPSPGSNHYGEYIRWAEEFVASEVQFFYDPAEENPWKSGKVPEWLYSLTDVDTRRPWMRPDETPGKMEDAPLKASGEEAVPIMEGIQCGMKREIAAINVPNQGAIPNLPHEMVVEIPAVIEKGKLYPTQMAPLPEGIAAMIRMQGSINQLLVEAFVCRELEGKTAAGVPAGARC
jgi:alpha-galactosidase